MGFNTWCASAKIILHKWAEQNVQYQNQEIIDAEIVQVKKFFNRNVRSKMYIKNSK